MASHPFAGLTNQFSRFVGPLVDEVLKGLLHGVDESLTPRKAALCHVVHLVLKVQQFLHHVLVLLWGTYNLSPEGLRPEKGSTMLDTRVLMVHALCCVFMYTGCWLSYAYTFM